jgi:hypothetical protein
MTCGSRRWARLACSSSLNVMVELRTEAAPIRSSQKIADRSHLHPREGSPEVFGLLQLRQLYSVNSANTRQGSPVRSVRETGAV